MPAGPPSFTETWGCQFIAYSLNAVFYGLAALLGIIYAKNCPESEKITTKVFVALMEFFATIQFIFVSFQVYVDFVDRFGDLEKLDAIPFQAPTMLLAIYLTAFTAQIYYARTIWKISNGTKRWALVAPVVLLALVQIGAGIAQTIFVILVGRYSKLASTERVTSVQSAATAACDVLITVILCVVLHESRSGIASTNNVLNKMILYAINRGIATSTCAFLNLVLFVAKPGTFIFMIPLLPSCQLYVISTLSMLLSRQTLRDKLSGRAISDASISGSFQLRAPSSQGRSQQQAVHIEHSVVTWHEVDGKGPVYHDALP